MAFDIRQLLQSLNQMMGMGDQPNTFAQDAGNTLANQPPTTTDQSGGLGSLLTLKNGQSALDGLSTLSGILNSSKQNKLAREQFGLVKDISNTNLNNSIKSYNTALGDRANARAFTQNQDQSVADAYYDKNRLTR